MKYSVLKKLLACTDKNSLSSIGNVNFCNGVIYATDGYVLIRIDDDAYSDCEKNNITHAIDDYVIKGKAAGEYFTASENEFSHEVEKPLLLSNVDKMLQYEHENGRTIIDAGNYQDFLLGINCTYLIKALNVFKAAGFDTPQMIDTGAKLHFVAKNEHVKISCAVMKAKLN